MNERAKFELVWSVCSVAAYWRRRPGRLLGASAHTPTAYRSRRFLDGKSAVKSNLESGEREIFNVVSTEEFDSHVSHIPS